MDDMYWNLIEDNWDNIIMVYQVFKNKKPIIEYEVNTQRIYSYPPYEYINTLTLRTRDYAKKQYQEVVKNNQLLLFVRDNKNKKLKSYVLNLPT